MTPLAVSYFFLLFIIVGLLLWLGVTIANLINKAATRMTRLLVIVPEGLINPFKEHRKSEIQLSEELYKRLGEMKIPFVLETEVPGIGEEIHFFISVSRRFKKSVALLIETLWDNASLIDITESESWHAGIENGVLKIGCFEQARPYSIPIRLAKRGHFEPFVNVLRILSKLAPIGEGASIQWIVRPADPRITHDVGTLLTELHNGKYRISKHLHETFVITPENIKNIERKIKQPLFFVSGKVASMTGSETKSHAILHEIADQTSSQSTDQINFLQLIEAKQPEKAFKNFLDQTFDDSQTMVLSSEELATLFDFPGPTTPIPKIKRQ